MPLRAWAALAVMPLLAACAAPPQACTAPLKPALQVSLYFGRDTPQGEVSEAEWARFVAEEVTPRFPAGLSVVEVAGQYTEPGGRMVREKTKLLLIVVFDAPAHLSRIQAIVDAFSRRHGQHSVFRTEQVVCAGA